ncbi:glycosyl-transferase for dystroglycan-domain-containing protein [Radiomyces spectabilis]|uniref:glycosyl-transferase for dystroglycan-domain-containing protein n=1 Tax=Radiomyces spectabilis TaxID=64574 RepID=UPI002220D909|nr:glycosyl-transferase for dystroglycan-domain-containing protein [Radiomyces spectabilis]KAI8368248.1 glycosyl-transferase for dystroglycan-domain-containing protein [Radiomyces spectabilis]
MLFGSPSRNGVDKTPIYTKRKHYRQSFHANHITDRLQLARLDRAPRIILLLAGVILVCMLLRSSVSSTASYRQLRDQPTYNTELSLCKARLCNPAQKCSTWTPGHYTWSELAEQNLYRDVATIDVDVGCDLRIKVQSEDPRLAMDDVEWMTVVNQVDCLGGKQCRNLIEMDLRADIYALASQFKHTPSDQETVISHAIPSSVADDITLISQFSVNRLSVFAEVIKIWEGPISIAIYLTEPEDIDTLQSFFSNVENRDLFSRVSFTLLKPDFTNLDRLRYPINHLRNLAISAASTGFIFVFDADFLPSENLYNYVRKLLPTMDSKTALVVPCYAIRESYRHLPFPRTINDLRSLVDQNIAYITDPGAGHGPTLAKEIALASPMKQSTTGYEVCFESQWEPYYIVPKASPLYDVRFRNQGGDKQSHALQLNAEGYRFMVLHHVFMIHKDHSKMVWPGGGFEKSQKAKNQWNYFSEFMQEMQAIYGKNVRWPRGCSAQAVGWQEQRRNILGVAAGAA